MAVGIEIIPPRESAARKAPCNQPSSDHCSAPAIEHNCKEQLLASVLEAVIEGDAEKGFRNLANRLRETLDCHAVFVGTCKSLRRGCHLQAISRVAQFRRHAQLASCAEDVLTEAALRGTIHLFDGKAKSRSTTDTATRLAQLSHVDHIVSGPIRDRHDATIGAWLVLQEHPKAQRKCPTTEQFPAALGPCVELLNRCRPTWPELLRQLVGGTGKRTRRLVIALAIIALIAVMAFPFPYRVKTDCELQAVTRRYVPVPYEGVLQEVLVEPGDVVRSGQVLARMDGRDVEWELTAQQAEFSRAKKQWDVHLAAHDTAAVQIAEIQMQRSHVQIQLLQNRLDNLEIRSPMDGVVIAGDPKKRERARLKKGETLFEIGPLENMVAQLLVPDEQMALVQEGQDVIIRLDAQPGESIEATIRRVNPQAEIRNHQNVFVAEVDLANASRKLRPGMAGSATIATVTRPLAWNLFHRPYYRLMYILAW